MELQKIKLADDIVVGCYFCLNPSTYAVGSHSAQRTLYLCDECSKKIDLK